MEGNRFKEGMIIKGKDMEGYTLCKILSEDMNMRGFQYKIGMNEDINPLEREGCCKAGLHFCLVQDVCKYLDYGTKLAVVGISDEEDVYVDTEKFRTHRLEIREVMPLNEAAAWEYLVKNGAEITMGDDQAVRWAAMKGYLEIVKYLHKNGADITAADNYTVRYASVNGHLDVVRYLHKNGADITARDNFAVQMAAKHGHLEIVKYLHENGADITAECSHALRLAAENGHLEVVKYLHENGADIRAVHDHAIKAAARNGDLEMVRYLYENSTYDDEQYKSVLKAAMGGQI